MRRGVAIGAACLFVTGCGPSPGGPEKPPSKTPTPALSASASAAAEAPGGAPHILPEDVDLEISVAPTFGTTAVVRVTIAARGDGLTVWQSPKSIDFDDKPEAHDAIGPIPVTTERAGGKTRLTLGKAPTGTVWLSYTVRGGAVEFNQPPAILVDPDRFAAAGEAMIVVPSSMEDKPVRGVLRLGMDDIGTSDFTLAATSFGLGAKVAAEARGSELREAFFVAGFMGQGNFKAPEGNDSAAWLGFTAFDPRPGFADMAGFRTALRQLFGAPDSNHVTLLFLSDRRSPGDFVVTRRPRSVVTWVSERDAWTAPLRIAVATAVVHGWIGSRLWVGPSDAEHEAEAYWFTEGIARHLARDLLFRFGLISPMEAAQEVEGLASVLATSPRGAESNEALRKDPKGALPVLVARGSLYGLRTDARLRAKTTGKRSLQNVLRELYKQAAEVKAPLPAKAWLDVIAQDLGDSERTAFHDLIESGKPVDLPDNALGPCFRRVTRTYTAFDLGFDELATKRAGKLTGLEKGGPAERAGLREGEEIPRFTIDRRSADGRVEVTVVRTDKQVVVSYRPEGKKGKGPGFERKKDVGDDACTP